MDRFTHEQCFWPFRGNDIFGRAQRLDLAIRFVTERGGEPVFFHKGSQGGSA